VAFLPSQQDGFLGLSFVQSLLPFRTSIGKFICRMKEGFDEDLVRIADIIARMVPSVSAQDWAKAMFSEARHDFGIVARGAKVEYQFTIENLYEEDPTFRPVIRVANAQHRKSTSAL